MPISYHIDPKRRLMVNLATGAITGEDFFTTQEAIRNDPAYDPGYDQLIDLTAADLRGLASVDVRNMADASVFGATARRAVVVSGALEFGLVRMFQIIAEGKGRIEVFTDRATAEAWLQSNPSTMPSELAPPPDDP